MSTNFPTNLDTYSDKTSADTITAATTNNMQDALGAIEVKIGKDSSTVTTSLDYLVKNTSSSNPGHKHTLANGASDVNVPVAQVNLGIVKCARLKLTATSETEATLELTSRSNGDAVGSTAITAGYSGTNFAVSAAGAACTITIKDAAISGTVQSVLSVIPVVPLLTANSIDVSGAVSGSTIVISLSSLTGNQSTANILGYVFSQTYKIGIWDILYVAF